MKQKPTQPGPFDHLFIAVTDPAVIEKAKAEHAARMADAKKWWAELRRNSPKRRKSSWPDPRLWCGDR